jgi:hypothetical protein
MIELMKFSGLSILRRFHVNFVAASTLQHSRRHFNARARASFYSGGFGIAIPGR